MEEPLPAHEYTTALRVFSDTLSLAELTARLGAPTDGHDRGDPVSRRNPVGPQHTSALWLLSGGAERTIPLHEHIAVLVAYMEARAPAFDSLPTDCECDISCGVFTDKGAQGGFSFEVSLMQRLAKLGLPVVFDLY